MIATVSKVDREVVALATIESALHDPSLPLLITFNASDARLAVRKGFRAIEVANVQESSSGTGATSLYSVALENRIVGVLTEVDAYYELKDDLIHYLNQRGAQVVEIEIPGTTNEKKSALRDLYEYVGQRATHTFDQIFHWRRHGDDGFRVPIIKVSRSYDGRRLSTCMTLPNGVSVDLPHKWGVCDWWKFACPQ